MESAENDLEPSCSLLAEIYAEGGFETRSITAA
jgi:hypothetical protein